MMVTTMADGRSMLTHSRMACAKTCLRKHFFAYELGVRKEDSGTPLRVGSHFHNGLDLLAQGKSIDDAVAAVRGGYAELPGWVQSAEQERDWLAESETCVAMLCVYNWRWRGLGVKVIATEQQFELPVINPETGAASKTWIMAGKIDKIIEMPDGRMAIMEHKTTSDSIDSESDYWKRLRLDSQISLYVIAARELGYNVETVYYDVARKPRHSLLLATPAESRKHTKEGKLYANQREVDETPDAFGQRVFQEMYQNHDSYFQRKETPRLESDLDEFRWELWQQQQLLRECQRSNRWYRNTGACLSPFKCEYFDVCVNGIDPSKNMPTGFVKLEHVHPELEHNQCQQ